MKLKTLQCLEILLNGRYQQCKLKTFRLLRTQRIITLFLNPNLVDGRCEAKLKVSAEVRIRNRTSLPRHLSVRLQPLSPLLMVDRLQTFLPHLLNHVSPPQRSQPQPRRLPR